MARLVLSLLDRLLTASDEKPTIRAASLDDLKISVRRDLEYLLNTPKPSHLEEPNGARRSGTIVDYGLPEFIGLDLADPNARTRLAVAVEQTIRAFEPRLANVSVASLLESAAGPHTHAGGASSMQLSLRVRAELRYQFVREKVHFRAQLDGASGRLMPGEISEDA